MVRLMSGERVRFVAVFQDGTTAIFYVERSTLRKLGIHVAYGVARSYQLMGALPDKTIKDIRQAPPEMSTRL
jgi:hypothetical protein